MKQFIMLMLSALLMSCHCIVNSNAKGIEANNQDSTTVQVEEKQISKPTTVKENPKTEKVVAKKPYKISKVGKDLIKDAEGLKLEAYHCNNEKSFTIGYGHVCKKDENIGRKISKQQAEAIFEKDMEKTNTSINKLINKLPYADKVEFTQGFIDAFGSMIYNCGSYGLEKTTFFTRLKNCRYDEKNHCLNHEDFMYALEAIKTTKCSLKGLKIRRQKEYQLAIS